MNNYEDLAFENIDSVQNLEEEEEKRRKKLEQHEKELLGEFLRFYN